MNEFVIEIVDIVFLWRKSNQTLLVDVYFQRSRTCDEYINSHIDLVVKRVDYFLSTYQKRIVDVPLHYIAWVISQFAQIFYQKYFSSSTQITWLADPDFRFILALPHTLGELVHEVRELVRKDEGSRSKCINCSIHILGLAHSYSHFSENSAERVFSTKDSCLWKMVQSLVCLSQIVVWVTWSNLKSAYRPLHQCKCH